MEQQLEEHLRQLEEHLRQLEEHEVRREQEVRWEEGQHLTQRDLHRLVDCHRYRHASQAL